jgi:hypothetical protein
MTDNRRLTKRFATQASAGADSELTEKVSESATVEHLSIRIYRGAELDLELTPFLERDGTERTSLVDLVGKDHIDGDDDRYKLDVLEPVSADDVIGVEYNNQDNNNPHNFSVDVTLDRAGGQSRVLSLLRRWF